MSYSRKAGITGAIRSGSSPVLSTNNPNAAGLRHFKAMMPLNSRCHGLDGVVAWLSSRRWRVRYPLAAPITPKYQQKASASVCTPLRENGRRSIRLLGTNNASNCLMERQAPDKRPRGSSILPRSTNSRRTTWRWSPASQAGETSSKLVRGTKI